MTPTRLTKARRRHKRTSGCQARGLALLVDDVLKEAPTLSAEESSSHATKHTHATAVCVTDSPSELRAFGSAPAAATGARSVSQKQSARSVRPRPARLHSFHRTSSLVFGRQQWETL